jgi:transketolase
VIPPTDVATGSLGQGLPIAVGVALAGKQLDRLPYRVWCLCGDSEMAEGSMWEAFQHAAATGSTTWSRSSTSTGSARPARRWSAGTSSGYSARLRAFGWHAIEIDGHDVERSRPPTATPSHERAADGDHRPHEEGQGRQGRRGPAGQARQAARRPDEAIAELGGERDLSVQVASPRAASRTFVSRRRRAAAWDLGEEVATRKAYGEALTALGSLRGDVVALDGEVSNSTHSELFREAHPDRYFEMFIAEQQMIAGAVGMQVRGWVPFASTFAAFLTRAYDFVRMAAVSRADLRLSGSHAGISIGEDGPSQMALEDIAAFRAIHGSTVLHPSDANQAAKLVAAMADREGISFIRTLRGKTAVRTPAGEDVRIGGSRVAHEGDDVAIVACGITVDQAVEAAER